MNPPQSTLPQAVEPPPVNLPAIILPVHRPIIPPPKTNQPVEKVVPRNNNTSTPGKTPIRKLNTKNLHRITEGIPKNRISDNNFSV